MADRSKPGGASEMDVSKPIKRMLDFIVQEANEKVHPLHSPHSFINPSNTQTTTPDRVLCRSYTALGVMEQ